ncbi:unnamed protein product [Leuciscus chuanchicus]
MTFQFIRLRMERDKAFTGMRNASAQGFDAQISPSDMAGSSSAVVADCLQPPSTPSYSEPAVQDAVKPGSSGAEESVGPVAKEIPGPSARPSGGKGKSPTKRKSGRWTPTRAETSAASLSLNWTPDLSTKNAASGEGGDVASASSASSAFSGSSTSPCVKQTLCKNAHAITTSVQKPTFTSKAENNVLLHLAFIIPKARSIIVRPREWHRLNLSCTGPCKGILNGVMTQMGVSIRTPPSLRAYQYGYPPSPRRK